MPTQAKRRRLSARGGLLAIAFLSLGFSQGCVYIAGFAAPKIETVVVESSARPLELNRIAVIDISGFISSEDPGPIFGRYTTTVADVRERLKRAGADWRVRAVVLRINSPGGEVTAADIMREQIVSFRQSTGKPVVASLMSVAASGGYYVATGADRVLASPTTTTGSVGVIMEYYNVEGLLEKIGVEPVTVRSGDKKGMGSSVKPLAEEEREIFQGIATAYFNRFVKAIEEGRPRIREEDLSLIKDGRVLTAAQALNLRMVDRVGYLDDALKEAMLASGITSADVVMYRRGHMANLNMYAQAQNAAPADWADIVKEGVEMLSRRQGASFLYLWKP